MSENKILVCVTGQLQCARLIRRGRELADAQRADLLVLHVRTRQKTLMGSPDITAALNQLYAEARGADAEMEIITSPEVEKTITDYARTHQVTGIVIGASPRDGGPSMGERLQTLMPDVRIETMRES